MIEQININSIFVLYSNIIYNNKFIILINIERKLKNIVKKISFQKQ